MRAILRAALAAALFAVPAIAAAGTNQTLTANVAGKSITVYSYLPDCTPRKGLLFAFHGSERTATTTRSAAVSFADKQCLRVYAPQFDSATYPNADYQRGGVKPNGPTTGRTVDLVDDLITWGLGRMADKTMPVWLFGHSAGGQFLSRVAAFAPPERANRIIIANPSTWVIPSEKEDAAYGFDMTTDDKLDAQEEALMRGYLAAPVTVYLGSEDTVRDADLADSAAAERQGANRYERGINTFEHAKRVAQERGWPFAWTQVTADGIGHSSGGMLRAPEMLTAMESPPATVPTPDPCNCTCQ